MSTQEYYIVSVRCRQVKAYDGSILTKEDEVVWLGFDDGYIQCQRVKSQAHHFKDLIALDSSKWDGMPWYCRLKAGTQLIFKVRETHIVERSEEHVDD